MINFHTDHKQSHRPRWFWLAGVVLLCVLAFVAGAVCAKFWRATIADIGQGLESDETTESGSLDDATEEVQDGGNALLQNDLLVIDWIAPEKQPEVHFDSVLYSVLCTEVKANYQEGSDDSVYNPCFAWQSPVADARAHRLGVVRGGEYDGYYLDMHTALQPGMGVYWESYYLLRSSLPEIQPVVLGTIARSSGWMGTHLNYITSEMLGEERLAKLRDAGYEIEMDYSVREFSLEDRIVDTRERAYRFTGYGRRFDASGEPGAHLDTYVLSTPLAGGGKLRYQNINDPDSLKDVSGEVQPTNSFVMLDEDGRVINYELELPFWNYEPDTEYGQKPPYITWNDGTENTMIYFKGKIGGCGFETSLNVISDEIISTLPEMSRVGVGIGKDGSKKPMFEPVTYDHPYYSEGFNALSKVFWSYEKVEKTFADFRHPYLYFQDSFGRWVEMVSIEMIPPVECGKPVIYLYPESETDLTLRVLPKGGFTFTEPEYNDGWRVMAFPDGQIVNKDDGKKYPYLFWEGRGGLYAQPLNYWVVERNDVDSFLKEKLSAMGFIEKEIKDFVEFWVPRMQSSPYYKIGFHDTRVMNELAPLEFSVEPDNIFRILMDFSGLSAKIPSKPPSVLPRANRDGFEVVEWGGVIR
jgi:hypothetical protein